MFWLMGIKEYCDLVADEMDCSRIDDTHRELVLYGSCLNRGASYCEGESCPDCDHYSPDPDMGMF